MPPFWIYRAARFAAVVALGTLVSGGPMLAAAPNGRPGPQAHQIAPAWLLPNGSGPNQDLSTGPGYHVPAGTASASPHAAASTPSPSSGGGSQPKTTGALPFAYGTTVTPATDTTARARQYASYPIGGISWGFHWSDLEPSPNVYNWTELDRAVAGAAAVHLPALLRVISGPNSPGWVLASVPTVLVPNQYFPNPAFYANPTRLPVMWDGTYLSDWETFLRAFGARYNGNKEIYTVAMTGPSIWGDMYLPPDMAAWNGAGYSDSKLQSAWQQVVSTYVSAFPRTPVVLGLAEAMMCKAVSPNFVNPTCSAAYRSNVLAPVYNWVHTTYPGKVWLQQNNLKGSNLGRVLPLRQMIEQASNWSSVGYQMGGMALGATDLHQAFEVARQDHASYVEVYLPDIENPAYAPDLRYLRYG